MNNAMNSHEQCVNSDFCPLHSEPMWGYYSCAGKKKFENAESENADAHPKHTLYVINKRDTPGVTLKELHLL